MHTPGPWTFKTDDRTGDNGIMAPGTGVFAEAYAEIRRSGENARAEALDNARLITAAPDLLETLQAELQSLLEDLGTAESSAVEGLMARITRIETVIDKAEGRA